MAEPVVVSKPFAGRGQAADREAPPTELSGSGPWPPIAVISAPHAVKQTFRAAEEGGDRTLTSSHFADLHAGMDAKYPGQGHDRLVAVATVIPVFTVVALSSTLEKALLAATVFGAVWVAVTQRWQNRRRAGFWGLVGLFALANALVIWVLPVVGPFKSALEVSYPIGVAEGFLLYWLLGRLQPNTR